MGAAALFTVMTLNRALQGPEDCCADGDAKPAVRQGEGDQMTAP